jgi:site-specific DNA recombinase
MMDDAEAGHFSVVLVYKTDRLSRRPVDLFTLCDRLETHDVGLISTTEPFDTTTAMGKMVLGMLAVIAGFERNLIIERTVDAEARMKELGTLVCGPAPFGFKHEDKKLLYDPETLPVAKEILRRSGSGEPERKVAHSLGLTRDQVRSVLHNSLFAGKIAYDKRGKNGTRVGYDKWTYVDYVGIEPILEFDDWLSLQQELALRSDRSEGSTLPLFGRMIYCTKCKHLLSAHGSSKSNKTEYACQSAGGGQKACGAQLLEHNLLPVFVSKLSEELRYFVPKFDGTDRLIEMDRKIAKYDRDITQLEGRLAIPEVSVEKVRERIAVLRTLKHEALQERAEIGKEKAQLEEVNNVLANFEPFFHSLDRKSQLEVVHRFARRIDLGVTNIVIHWRFSENECKMPRLEVSPRARKTGVRGRVVEIGAANPLCVQHNPQSALLLHILRASVQDACRRPTLHTKRERKTRRGKRARA